MQASKVIAALTDMELRELVTENVEGD